jgi:C1A family cysteine protease
MLPLSPAGRRYGFKPSLPDATAKRFKVSLPVAIPPVVDLTPWCGPVKDQGALGACTAFAGTGYLEYLYRRFKGSAPIFSPLFLYYKEREMDGDLGQGDTGSFGSTTVRVINQIGVCQESVDPYDTAAFEKAPTPAQIADAANWKAGAYHAMSVPDIRFSIASNYPVLIGISVYDSFESGNWGSDWVMPAPAGPQLGGHEVYAKGYDDNRGAFSIRNSWGAAWGLSGDFWLPYSLLEGILSEARMIHFGAPWK